MRLISVKNKINFHLRTPNSSFIAIGPDKHDPIFTQLPNLQEYRTEMVRNDALGRTHCETSGPRTTT